MGGIVRSIGRAVTKFGKSAGKFLKKYRTTIILAAALWAGLGAFGVSHAAAGTSMWSPKAVSAGVARIFSPAVASGLPIAPAGNIAGTPLVSQEWLQYVGDSSKYATNMAKSSSVLSGLKKWFGDMPPWGKYALTQAGMTIVGSMLDTSAEDALAAKYGQMGIPYGTDVEDPTAIFDEHPEWRVQAPPSWPSVPTTTSQTSTPQQAQLTRAPGVTREPRSQQITAMRTMPFDVRPPGMISGRSPGLISTGAKQRRYA